MLPALPSCQSEADGGRQLLLFMENPHSSCPPPPPALATEGSLAPWGWAPEGGLAQAAAREVRPNARARGGRSLPRKNEGLCWDARQGDEELGHRKKARKENFACKEVTPSGIAGRGSAVSPDFQDCTSWLAKP